MAWDNLEQICYFNGGYKLLNFDWTDPQNMEVDAKLVTQFNWKPSTSYYFMTESLITTPLSPAGA